MLIADDAQLLHISRYIHLNPSDCYSWKWSSLSYYLGNKSADWLMPNRILELHGSRKAYKDFLDDYEKSKDELAALQDVLAG